MGRAGLVSSEGPQWLQLFRWNKCSETYNLLNHTEANSCSTFTFSKFKPLVAGSHWRSRWQRGDAKKWGFHISAFMDCFWKWSCQRSVCQKEPRAQAFSCKPHNKNSSIQCADETEKGRARLGHCHTARITNTLQWILLDFRNCSREWGQGKISSVATFDSWFPSHPVPVICLNSAFCPFEFFLSCSIIMT